MKKNDLKTQFLKLIQIGKIIWILQLICSCATHVQHIYKNEMGMGFQYETTANDFTYKYRFDGVIELDKLEPSIDEIEKIKKGADLFKRRYFNDL